MSRIEASLLRRVRASDFLFSGRCRPVDDDTSANGFGWSKSVDRLDDIPVHGERRASERYEYYA